MRPLIRYLVSSPYGDIPADKNKWDLPLEGDSLKTPYRIYFHSITDFLTQDDFKPLTYSINKKLGREIHLNDVNEIIIRSEKHGLLYHPSSIELILKEEKIKFGLNVAISEVGKDWLREEFSVLKRLNTKFKLPYLPEPYFFGELNAMSFLTEDWFEGYHEFHISKDEEGKQRLKLWDFDSGYKYLSSEQSFELYKRASKILTLYYDLNDFSQIYPWHHAAGDFVVKIEDENNPPHPPLAKGGEGGLFIKRGMVGLSSEKVDVRLTTARRYKPLIYFKDKESLNTVWALLCFFLNLTIGMRLDKLDGLGESVWVEDFCAEATVQGFLEALRLKDELRFYFNSEDEFFNILQSFTREDIKTIFSPLIDLYKETSDFTVIRKNLDKHIEELYAILQILPL